MYQDLHSHTYYSFCGKDSPETVAEAAAEGGLDLLGITDHNYGVAYARLSSFTNDMTGVEQDCERTLLRYWDHIDLVRQKYKNRIRILRGIEINTLPDSRFHLPPGADISFFDFCLIENLDCKDSITGGDIFSFADRCATEWTGVAHTDLFSFIQSRGDDPMEFFSRMAEKNIFWEMNISFDSIHSYREHNYMIEFFSDKTKQEIVRRSGVRVSIGFDGHRVEDYLPDRIKDYCCRLTEAGIKMPFEP